MAEAAKKTDEPAAGVMPVAPAPHLASPRTTRQVMADVLVALAPAFAVGCYVFHWHAVKQVAVCVVSCVAFEAIWQALRHRRRTVGDLSAAVTGAILGLSIPWAAPWYVGVVGSGVAIVIAKMLFGGLGANVFNPAMAGRAFLQACFAGEMTRYFIAVRDQAGEVIEKLLPPGIDAVSTATPLGTGEVAFTLRQLAVGTVNGSVGETSAIACAIGGAWLIWRRAASWRVPAAMLTAAAVVAGIHQLANPEAAMKVGHHLLAGSMMFGACFIVTDPATSPLSKRGRWIYGAGVGVLVMLIRLFANVPEGVMYSVLVMNMSVPLIDRWTVPRPVGGPVPRPQAAA